MARSTVLMFFFETFSISVHLSHTHIHAIYTTSKWKTSGKNNFFDKDFSICRDLSLLIFTHTHTHSVSLSGLLPAFQIPSSLKVRVISHTLRKLSAPCCCWNMKPIITDEMLSLRMLLIDSWPLKLQSFRF